MLSVTQTGSIIAVKSTEKTTFIIWSLFNDPSAMKAHSMLEFVSAYPILNLTVGAPWTAEHLKENGIEFWDFSG